MVDIKSLERVRKKAGLTLDNMAADLKISRTAYYMYEKGERPVPAEIAEEIAKLLKVEKEEIFLPSKFTLREKS